MSHFLFTNLTKEATKHGDMILLPDVSDEHRSLSYRTLASFQYVVQNLSKEFLYVMKCDDDTFVDLLAVTKELSHRSTNAGVFWGQFLGAGGVIKEGPYAEFSWSICDTYLPYALGGGYILSMDLVQLVARNAPFLRVYRNEDVSIGAWLAPYNIEFVSDTRFNTGAVTKGCKKSYIVIHRVNVTQMHSYLEAVLSDGFACSRKNHWFVWHGYRYNWKAKPSRCCRVRKGIL
jgi:galactosylxylosylprotein 3-beta-galactosyltransferase